MAAKAKRHGLLAEFPDTAAIYHAAEKTRDGGYKHFDCYTPFPVHGLDKAMGVPASPIPFVVLVLGFTGASLGMLMQWWMSAVGYPLVIAAKPLFSWPAFVPVTFELGVLFGALGAVGGILHFCRLPRWHHPLFSSTRFERATDDGFFLCIEASDPLFDEHKTTEFLKQAGAVAVEPIDDED